MSEEKNIEEQSAENVPEEIISSEQISGSGTASQPETTKTQDKEMEVHHHAHHGGKKNWKNYFWEFLMLFLAVFCGFLAEYYLEHRIEKERGNQFIKSFYEDLKTDTGRISFYTNYDEDKIQVLNNLSQCYDTVLSNMNNTSCLLDIIQVSSINRPFMRTDRTLKQLANAGGFRLLKKEDADSILSYDKDFNNFLDFQSTVFQDAQDIVRASFNLLADFKANVQMFRPQQGQLISNFNSKEVTAAVLFSGDKGLLNKYFNDLMLYYRTTYNHKRMLLNLKNKQGLLLAYFKDKYHFE